MDQQAPQAGVFPHILTHTTPACFAICDLGEGGAHLRPRALAQDKVLAGGDEAGLMEIFKSSNNLKRGMKCQGRLLDLYVVGRIFIYNFVGRLCVWLVDY